MSGVSKDLIRCAVLVIGAGPGGASAAYVLARAGVDVVLADRVHFPRDKPCGDGLTPYCVEILDDMGVTQFLVEHGRPYSGVRVHKLDRSITRISLQADSEGKSSPGYVLPRYNLDNALVELAILAGARFLPGFIPISFAQDAGINVATPSFTVAARWEGRIIEVCTNLLIIATGANRRLLNRIGLAVSGAPTALGLRAYMGSLQGLEQTLEIFLDEEILPGYGWIYPTGDETANVGVGVHLYGKDISEGIRQMHAAFRRLLNDERLAKGVLVSRIQGYPIHADYPLTPTCFPGGLVVGEAAGLVDPITGEGLSPALVSGHLAALTAIDAIRVGDFSYTQLQEYADFLRIKYGRYFSDGQNLIRWLAGPGVIKKLINCAREDQRIAAALDLAIKARRPGAALELLIEVTGETCQ